jgi:flagellin-like hook-associated protein FlgL
LATVTDASEQSFINGQLAGKEGWIGASDQDVEGNWVWLTGPEAGTQFYRGSSTGSALASKFANWDLNEPNDSGNNEDYAYIKGNGKWNDYAGSVNVGSYVVEYGGGGAFGTYAAPTLTATDLQNIRARVTYSDSSANKDTASVTINGQTITSAPTLRGGESIATALETAIKARINAGTLQNVVVQRYGNTLNLQSTVPGTAFDLSAASTNHSGNTISAQTVTENKTAGTTALETGDLEIQTDKGSYAIPASIAAADPKSNSIAAGSNNAGSAIAIAAAINNKLAQTGVSATANGAEIKGAKTTVSANSIQTDLFVNGTKVSLSLTAGQTDSQRRAYVMNSINAQTEQHGVVAGDPGNGGLTLTTIDGRNLSVWYDGSVAVGSDFGLGMNTATTSDPEGVTGLASAAMASATGTGAVKASTVYGTVTLNSDKEFSIKPGPNSYPTEITTTTSNQFTFAGNSTTKDVSFNFNGKNGTFSTVASGATTAANFVSAVNSLAGTKVAFTSASFNGASATAASGVTTLTMSAADVAGLIPGMAITGTGIPSSTTISSISGNTVTLSAATTAAITSIATATYPSPAGTNTVYMAPAAGSSITFTTPNSDYKPSTAVASGTTGFSATTQVEAKDPTYSNLSSLGFVPGAVMAKSIGRLNFQVGPTANQLISIDLADFGKNGDITGPITSDKAPTNLLTVQSANDVIMNVNKSLDRIAATRATMGAVMNRLTHVIDNLTNVVMNSESSRSQIEDADYAKASTELARTQIMQQAATAVLAQANVSSQMVLKLLEQN